MLCLAGNHCLSKGHAPCVILKEIIQYQHAAVLSYYSLRKTKES